MQENTFSKSNIEGKPEDRDWEEGGKQGVDLGTLVQASWGKVGEEVQT